MHELNATVIAREPVGDATAIVRIQPDSGQPLFRPGQHLTVGVPDNGVLVMRPYSVASAAGGDVVELYMSEPASGPNRRVYLSSHGSGSLTLDEVPRDRDLLMVATGTGIAPFVSIYRTFADQGRWRTFTLIHGVRLVRDLAYRQELERGTLTYVPVVSQEPWVGKRGRVQSVLALETRDRERTHVFLCGNFAMVTEVEQLAYAAGFSHVHLERY